MSAEVDARPALQIETRLFIGGEFVDAAQGGRIPVLNPHDNSTLAEVSEATAADIDRADAARKAFPACEMGPLTSPGHRDRVLRYIELAREEGSTILTGGKPPDNPALQAGCYIEPTVVTAKPEDRVCQEEVFGPFVSVTRFKDETEVIGIANSTLYGLGGGLWTRDLQRGHRVAGALRSGMVWVNSYKRVSPNSPFGGVGQSGYGRDMGPEALQEYTYAKAVWVNVDAQIPPFYKR